MGIRSIPSLVLLLLPTLINSFSTLRSTFTTTSSIQAQKTFFRSQLSSTSSSSFPLNFDDKKSDVEKTPDILPQVFATGYSSNPDLLLAITEAVTLAVNNLPPPPPHLTKNDNQIDLAMLTVSSLYDNQSVPITTVVPTLLTTAMNLYGTVKNVIGSTAGGIISWQEQNDDETDDESDNIQIIETEGTLGVSVTLALLPDVELKAFHVDEDDVPDDVTDDVGDVSKWKEAVHLNEWDIEPSEDETKENGAFFILPSPSFQTSIDDLLQGFQYAYPKATVFGGIASTVSSLSRARLFLYKVGDSTADPTVYNSGCIGIGLKGDIKIHILVAQGAKPVGGIYRIVDGEKSTIRIIVADEDATAAALINDGYESEKWKQINAKALIPKPPLAEANQIIKVLSDDNADFMKKILLVGLEKDKNRRPNELESLMKGQGYSYLVRQVASAGMKDGSITLPLESVSVEKGGRMRFFVREGAYCKKEVEAIWCGYQNKVDSKSKTEDLSFSPSACFMISTMDRGSKLFGAKVNKINQNDGFEGNEVKKYLPNINSISGFYGNGVLAGLDGLFQESSENNEILVHGSASCYAIFGSKSNRPTFNAAARKSQRKKLSMESKQSKSKSNTKSPRKENGELLLKRREVHSGRALTVSTVEWSVAEKIAQPTSVLEGFMWDKETEVDRFRERVPLPNLLSQCKIAMADPSKPAPRDWVSNVKDMVEANNGFAIIPECKRTEVVKGNLRERYDVAALAQQFVKEGDAKSLSVNCDSVMFGGSLDDIETVRNACGESIPILASDLLLYPYQLYKLRLAGADAVYLVAAALEGKDFLYLTKIAKSLKMQTVISVTSKVQIETLTDLLSPDTVDCLVLSNRDLETFEFDESGKQAISLVESEALTRFKKKHGDNMLFLVEGQVGVGSLGQEYIETLKKGGINGAIVGQGLAAINKDNGGDALKYFIT